MTLAIFNLCWAMVLVILAVATGDPNWLWGCAISLPVAAFLAFMDEGF